MRWGRVRGKKERKRDREQAEGDEERDREGWKDRDLSLWFCSARSLRHLDFRAKGLYSTEAAAIFSSVRLNLQTLRAYKVGLVFRV